jgi:hypothetical protein
MSLAVHPLAACLVLAPCAAAWAQAGLQCTSDGLAAPPVLQERFINADCDACWRQPGPTPPKGAAVLDWVVPGSLGDDAPLSAVARRESLERLDFLRLPVPGEHAGHASAVQGGRHHVHVSRGPVLGGYVGASLTFDSSGAPLQLPLTGWLALIEVLPAGTEGSPVPRALMRNLLSSTIAPRNTEIMGQLWRPMNVPEGAQPDRLQLLGWVSDAQGHVLAAAESSCDKPAAPD